MIDIIATVLCAVIGLGVGWWGARAATPRSSVPSLKSGRAGFPARYIRRSENINA